MKTYVCEYCGNLTNFLYPIAISNDRVYHFCSERCVLEWKRKTPAASHAKIFIQKKGRVDLVPSGGRKDEHPSIDADIVAHILIKMHLIGASDSSPVSDRVVVGAVTDKEDVSGPPSSGRKASSPSFKRYDIIFDSSSIIDVDSEVEYERRRVVPRGKEPDIRGDQ